MKKYLIILFIALTVSVQAQMQTIGYYPNWWYGSVNASDIDFHSLTYVIVFSAQDASASAPYFQNSSDDGYYFEQLVTAAHAAGTKVLISVTGGYRQTQMPIVAADLAKCSTFVSTACAWAQARGLDGIEIDWEFPRATDAVGWNQLIRLFRNELNTWTPHGYLMTSVNYTAPSSPPYYRDSMVIAFDKILHMSYTMWMGATQESPYYSGYDTPVHPPTQFSPYYGTSLETSGLLSWIAAGYPVSKMCVGLSFESTIFTCANPTMGQSYSVWSFGSVATTSYGGGYPGVPTTTRYYDAVAQAVYCVNSGKVYSYQDTNTVKAIVAWGRSYGYGGVMVYDIPAGNDATRTPHDILLQVIAREASLPYRSYLPFRK